MQPDSNSTGNFGTRLHVSCVYRRGTQQGGLRIGRKTTNVTKFAQALKALAPMLVTGDGIARLANELHRLKAPTPMLATDDGISMLPTSCIHRKPRKPRLRCWRLMPFLAKLCVQCVDGQVVAEMKVEKENYAIGLFSNAVARSRATSQFSCTHDKNGQQKVGRKTKKERETLNSLLSLSYFLAKQMSIGCPTERLQTVGPRDTT